MILISALREEVEVESGRTGTMSLPATGSVRLETGLQITKDFHGEHGQVT